MTEKIIPFVSIVGDPKKKQNHQCLKKTNDHEEIQHQDTKLKKKQFY